MKAIPDPRTRPAEYVVVLVASIFGVLAACGVDVPDALPGAATALAAILVTGAASYRRR